MHSSIHTSNSDFQNRYFAAGGCRTDDGAWAYIYAQRLQALLKIESMKAQALRRQAEEIEVEEGLNRVENTKAEQLRAQARAIEFRATSGKWELDFQGAQRELANLDRLMAEYEPKRKYAHLPILEAIEAAQSDEWEEELKFAAENDILARIYGVAPNTIRTARWHPNWKTSIEPHLQAILQDPSKVFGSAPPRRLLERST